MNRLARRRGGVAAAALAALALTAVSGTPTHAGRSSPGTATARAYQPRIGSQGAFIRVSWSRPETIPTSSILGYVIWRGDVFSQPQVVGGRDTDAVRYFVDSESTRTVTAYDGGPGGQGAPAGSRTTFQNVPGLIPGQQYTYQVNCAYLNGLQDIDGDGRPDTGEQLMWPLSRASQVVTAIAPPSITTINGFSVSSPVQIDPTSFQVEWSQAPGADRYVIMISRDPTFRTKKVVVGGGLTIPVELGGPQTVTRTVRIKKGFLKRARRLYITVGGRRSGEPKPIPFGAVFSMPVTVRPEKSPPPPP